MLQHLHIHNYVLIQNVSIDFSKGFNVLTGETGAGKSLIVDSLNFLCGQRITGNVIGNYDDKTYVEALFKIENPKLIPLLEEQGFEIEDELIVSREINNKGKNICRINNRLINVTLLKEIMSHLMDIHSQYETMLLLDTKNHINLLDSYIKSDLLLDGYHKEYDLYLTINKQINELKNTKLDPDMLAFSKQLLEELQQFNPNIDEYQELTDKIKVLTDREKHRESLKTMKYLLSGDDRILESLYSLREYIATIDSLKDYVESINTSYYEIEALGDYIDSELSETFDEYEFNTLNERLIQYNKYIKKYGSIEDIMLKIDELNEYISNYDNYDYELSRLENDRIKAYNSLMESGNVLRLYRQNNKDKLEKNIIKLLKQLHLKDARFHIEIDDSEPSYNGIDTIKFKASMNKGMTLEDIDKVASGGELSRFMLAMKYILSETMAYETIILDEIDTGVSGEVANAMGLMMKELSNHVQVISITHLPLVARWADSHFNILKDSDKQQTYTDIIELDGTQRIENLAYMMTGQLNETSLQSAKELLEKEHN